WSVVVSATTLGLVVFSRAASFDIVLTMTTTWALTFYFLHDVERNIKRLRLLLAGFYIFIGLALLAKGLIGMVIPVGVVGLFCLFQRRLPGRSTLISLLWGLPLTLLVAGAWYVPVIWRHGWPFIDQFFIQHHFARYLSNKYHHPRPIYYYLEIVPLLALPWSAFLIDGLLQSKLSLWRFSETGADKAEDRLKRLMVFALAWVLFPLVFFSFSRSKLPGYILPILPAVALIVGERLWRLSFVSGNEDSANSPARPRWPLKATAILCLAFAAGTFAYGWRAGLLSLVCALSIALPLMGAGCFALFRTRRPAESVMLIAAATTAALIFALNCAAPAYAERDSSRRLLQLADARGYAQTPINGMQRSDRTPEFYASGRIVYEADGEPVMYEGPNRVIWESGQRRQSYLVFVPLEELNKLTEAAAVQTEVIGNNGRYAIVAVSPR
ncbi:MAG TPA: hypothetical protein VK208_01420, partial [Pyrinomonadaceae bacterium]|nr:hypothetical protein [Pyrinomonadaceae bacterium]